MEKEYTPSSSMERRHGQRSHEEGPGGGQPYTEDSHRMEMPMVTAVHHEMHIPHHDHDDDDDYSGDDHHDGEDEGHHAGFGGVEQHHHPDYVGVGRHPSHRGMEAGSSFGMEQQHHYPSFGGMEQHPSFGIQEHGGFGMEQFPVEHHSVEEHGPFAVEASGMEEHQFAMEQVQSALEHFPEAAMPRGPPPRRHDDHQDMMQQRRPHKDDNDDHHDHDEADEDDDRMIPSSRSHDRMMPPPQDRRMRGPQDRRMPSPQDRMMPRPEGRMIAPPQDRMMPRSEGRMMAPPQDRMMPRSEGRMNPTPQDRMMSRSNDGMMPPLQDRMMPQSHDRTRQATHDRMGQPPQDRMRPAQERMRPAQERMRPPPQQRMRPAPQDRMTPPPEQRRTPPPQDRMTPPPQDRMTPPPQDRMTPPPQDRMTPPPQDRMTPTPQDRMTPTPQDRMTPTPQDRMTPTPQDRMTPPPRDRMRTPSDDRMSASSPDRMMGRDNRLRRSTQDRMMGREDHIRPPPEDRMMDPEHDRIMSEPRVPSQDMMLPPKDRTAQRTQEVDVRPSRKEHMMDDFPGDHDDEDDDSDDLIRDGRVREHFVVEEGFSINVGNDDGRRVSTVEDASRDEVATNEHRPPATADRGAHDIDSNENEDLDEGEDRTHQDVGDDRHPRRGDNGITMPLGSETAPSRPSQVKAEKESHHEPKPIEKRHHVSDLEEEQKGDSAVPVEGIVEKKSGREGLESELSRNERTSSTEEPDAMSKPSEESTARGSSNGGTIRNGRAMLITIPLKTTVEYDVATPLAKFLDSAPLRERTNTMATTTTGDVLEGYHVDDVMPHHNHHFGERDFDSNGTPVGGAEFGDVSAGGAGEFGGRATSSSGDDIDDFVPTPTGADLGDDEDDRLHHEDDFVAPLPDKEHRNNDDDDDDDDVPPPDLRRKRSSQSRSSHGDAPASNGGAGPGVGAGNNTGSIPPSSFPNKSPMSPRDEFEVSSVAPPAQGWSVEPVGTSGAAAAKAAAVAVAAAAAAAGASAAAATGSAGGEAGVAATGAGTATAAIPGGPAAAAAAALAARQANASRRREISDNASVSGGDLLQPPTRASRPTFTSIECQDDLKRLSDLRAKLTTIFTSPSCHTSALEAQGLDGCCEYYACLVEMYNRGFPDTIKLGHGCYWTCAFNELDRKSRLLSLYSEGRNKSSAGTIGSKRRKIKVPPPTNDLNNCDRSKTINSPENDGDDDEEVDADKKMLKNVQIGGLSSVMVNRAFINLRWERASVLFNVGALESYHANRHDRSTREGLAKSVEAYRTAYRTFRYLRTNVLPTVSITSGTHHQHAKLQQLQLQPPPIYTEKEDEEEREHDSGDEEATNSGQETSETAAVMRKTKKKNDVAGNGRSDDDEEAFEGDGGIDREDDYEEVDGEDEEGDDDDDDDEGPETEDTTFATDDLSVPALRMIERSLLAQGQVCQYQSAQLRPRPVQAVLSKLAGGACDLFREAAGHCGVPPPAPVPPVVAALPTGDSTEAERESEMPPSLPPPTPSPALPAPAGRIWGGVLQALSDYFAARAEQHEAKHMLERKRFGHEIGRLLRAEGRCDTALHNLDVLRDVGSDSAPKDGVMTSPTPSSLEHWNTFVPVDVVSLRHEIRSLKKELYARRRVAEKDNDTQHHAAVPQAEDMAPIRGQNLVLSKQRRSAHPSLVNPKLDPSVLSTPMFGNVLTAQAKEFLDLFESDLNRLLDRTTEVTAEETDAARRALAEADLPRSVEEYNARGSGNSRGTSGGGEDSQEYGDHIPRPVELDSGIPEDLWERIEEVQTDNEIGRLQEGLWQLRDESDGARRKLRQVWDLLEEDSSSDAEFRRKHGAYDGTKADEAQAKFRPHAERCRTLLEESKNGDEVLLGMLDTFEKDPKFKLLQCKRAQLDHLASTSMGMDDNGDDDEDGDGRHSARRSVDEQHIDTTELCTLLGDLSDLIRERETILKELEDEILKCDLRSKLINVKTTGDEAWREYEEIAREAASSFRDYVSDIEDNMDRQPLLLKRIFAENERFVQALVEREAESKGKCVEMLEEALGLIDWVKIHLGKGRNFYQEVMPQLNELLEEVSELSVRLAVERVHYEDGEARRMQEIEDARVAETFANHPPPGLSDPAAAAMAAAAHHHHHPHSMMGPYGAMHHGMGPGAPPIITSPPPSAHNMMPPHFPGVGGPPPPPVHPGAGVMHGGMGIPHGLLGPGAGGGQAHHHMHGHHGSPHQVPHQHMPTTGADGVQGGGPRPTPIRSSNPPPAGRPGAYAVSNFEQPPTPVDDGNVALLVSMGFDPDQAERALQNCDNNVDRALNHLLSGG